MVIHSSKYKIQDCKIKNNYLDRGLTYTVFLTNYFLDYRDILEIDLALPSEKVHEIADVAVAHANAAASELRRLFLVEDFIDSIKFSVMLWSLTYLGSWFNGMTLIIIGM